MTNKQMPLKTSTVLRYTMPVGKMLCHHKETMQHAMPVEILSTCAQIYEKLHFKVTHRHRK